jgi:porin
MAGPTSALPRLLVACWLALLLPGAGASEDAAEPRPLRGWLRGDAATGGWLGWRSRLADHGLSPYAVWTGEVFRKLHGGLEQTTDWGGLLEFGAVVDLERAVGWRGAGIHASALWVQADDDASAESAGNFDEISNIAADRSLHAYQLYLEHEPCDAYRYKVGQLVLDEDFMVSDASSVFINASFGALPVESANVPAPIYPLAALGGFAQWKGKPGIALQLGVYDGDAGTQDSNEDGFGYAFGSEEGAAVFAELQSELAPLGRDATWKLGGYYHSGAFTDYDTGSTAWGTYALYLVADQVLVGTRYGNRLDAFLRAGVSPPEDRSQVLWYLDAGFTARGLREEDRVGLGFSHTRFGSDFVSFRERAGSPTRDGESLVELTYRAQLTPWLGLQPDLQYLIAPQDAAVSNALLVGIRTQINF